MKCNFCQKEIIGRYFIYDNWLVVCLGCNYKLPKCAFCKIPIKNFKQIEGKEICLSCLSQLKTCSYCKKIILGEYVIYREKQIILCKDCLKNYPKCKACNLTIKKWTLINEEKFCIDCARKAKFCFICKGLIVGRYWTPKDSNKYYCDSCFVKTEHCVVCSIPIENNCFEVNGKKICSKCFKTLPQCKCCQKPILQKFWQYGRTEGYYCNYCHEKEVHCDVCGIPLKKDYIKLSDGRLICQNCHETAITSSEVAKKILESVESIILRKFKMKVKHSSQLRLVDKRTLRSVQEDKEENVLGLFKRINHTFDIYLLSHLPKSLAISVLSHEYAHAWQAENVPERQDISLREGFCEWISYHVLLELGLEEEVALMHKRKDIYGQGFKFMRKLELEKGIDYVINYNKQVRSTSIFHTLA